MNSLVKANVVAYRRRYAAVIAAITIGVAFLTATLFVGSSVRATLSASVGQSYQNADLVVEPKLYNVAEGSKLTSAAIQQRLTQTQGVTSTLFVGSNMVEAQLGESKKSAWVLITDGDASLLGTALTSGAQPGADQVTLNDGAAKDAGLSVGDQLTLTVTGEQGKETERSLTISGLRADSQDPGTAGYPAVQMTKATAAPLGLNTDADLLLAKLAPGTSAAATGEGLQTWMRDGGLYDAAAGAPGAIVNDKVKELSGGVDALTWVLGAFAGVALVVTIIVVANTFSVILAQRTRELALLRTLGARRKQIRSMVSGEALVIGLVGGLLGAAIGAGAVAGGAALVRALFKLDYVTFGFTWVPLAVGVVVGLVVTLLASSRPALAATRVSPLAALRPAETVTAGSKAGRTRIVVGLLLVLAGAGALVYGVLPVSVTGAEFTSSFGMAFLGGLLSFIGVLMLGTLLIPWAVRQLARPFGKKVAGRLAGLNALRHPQRTAAIGTALLLGVTLVTLMLVGATSARSTLNAELSRQYPVDLVLTGDAQKPFTAEVQNKVAAVEGVRATALVTPVGGTPSCFDRGQDEAASDEAAVMNCTFAYSADEQEITKTLTDGGVAPKPGSVAVGDYVVDGKQVTSIPLTDGAGRTVDVPIDWNASAPAMSVLMTEQTRTQLGLPAQLAPGKDARYMPATRMWVKADTSVDIGTFAAEISKAADLRSTAIDGALPIRQMASQIIDTLLMVVSALLAVAVVIALIGVSNTLSLSVIERTRENSLLRALGLTKKQLRGMLALEAALIAGAAAVLGLVLGSIYGLAGARAATSAMGGFSASMPWLWMLVVLAVSVGAAILASVWPARRAARMSPVEGLAVE